jgi:hypothetical protein
MVQCLDILHFLYFNRKNSKIKYFPHSNRASGGIDPVFIMSQQNWELKMDFVTEELTSDTYS